MHYNLWVETVQEILRHTYNLSQNSFLMTPHDGSPALRSWKEMFDRGTSPEQMAEWTFNVMN